MAYNGKDDGILQNLHDLKYFIVVLAVLAAQVRPAVVLVYVR